MEQRLMIDPELCIGSAECARIVPGAFRIDPETGVSAPTELAETADPALIEEAVRSCPTGAIAFHIMVPGEDVQE